MLVNYIKIGLRNLWKHRTHTIINVVGLAVAFATGLLLFLTAAFELSYDRFHADSDRIFRLYFEQNERDGKASKSASMPYPLTPALQAEIPEIEAVTRIIWGSGGIRKGNQTYNKMVRSCDAGFLKVFSFPLKKGDVNSALTSLSNIVISENMAKDVFGKEDPIGKSIQIRLENGWQPFVVTGVIGDFPDNSTQQYDALIRIENKGDYAENKSRWDHTNHEVYAKLKPGFTPAMLQRRLQAFTDKYFANDIKGRKEQGYPQNSFGYQKSLLMMPLTDVHFDTEAGSGQGISMTYIYTLLVVGLFILAIACINFINLTIAQAVGRAREVGVRKSLGAGRSQLFGQIWGETFLLCFVSLTIGLGLAWFFLPTFNRLFSSHLSLDSFLKPDALIVTGIGFILVTLVAGGYPSWFATRFNVVDVLKGKVSMKRPGLLRNSLIVAQFAIACLLIVCTLVMGQQIKYLREKPIGLNQEQVISIPVGQEIDGATALVQTRNLLSNNPNIVSVSASGVNIGAGLDGNSSRMMYGFTYNKRDIGCDWLRVDYNYLKTLGIKLLQGRDFSPTFGTDTISSVLITQSMAKQLGEANPVGKFIKPDQQSFQIVGVVSDFNLYSLHQKAQPVTLQMNSGPLSYILIRVTPQNLATAMETVKATWKQIAPKQEFKGSFLDENTDRWYKREQRLSTIFSTASGIAILLSCMGLFAIAVLSIEQRTKEIGVRKVLGASVSSIVSLLSKDFLKLVIIGIAIASPIAWWAMNEWLADFAYKTDMPWWVFIVGAGIAILVAFFTVSFQSVKAALMNPVKSLRSE
jgi:ABC-type antimicrobial peptide transport system permease subunit